MSRISLTVNIYIVLAHPERSSFNGSLVAVAREVLSANGHRVVISDLYEQNFDACEHGKHYPARRDSKRFDAQNEQRFAYQTNTLPIEVRRELDCVLWADLLVLQFPLWWFGVPAILKGWMDRVFIYEGLYSEERRFEDGLCAGKRVLLSVTTGASGRECASNGREGDARLLLWPVQYAFHRLGFDVLEAHLIHAVRSQTACDLSPELDRFREVCGRIADRPPVPFNVNADWDEHGQLRSGAASYTPFIQHEHP